LTSEAFSRSDMLESYGVPGAVEKSQVNRIYIVPFVLVLIFTIVSFKAQTEDAISTVTPLSDPVRQVVLGTSYVLAVVLLILKYKWTFITVRRNFIYFMAVFYVFLSSLWSNYPGIVCITFVHNIGFTAVVLCCVYYINDNISELIMIFVGIFLMLIVGSIVISIIVPSRGIYYNGRWMGVGSHPNELGFTCMVSVWSATSCIYCVKNRILRLAGIILLASATLCLYLSDSVTSVVCSFFMIASFLCFINRGASKPQHPAIRLLIYAWSGVGVLLAFYAFHPGPLSGRSIFDLLGRQSDLTGRTELWAAGAKAVARRPFLGWSFDSMASVLSKDIISYAQFHDGYLNLVVSGGFTGLIIFILILFRYVRLSKRILKTEYAATVSLAILVGSILIHNISEASIMRVTHPLWLIFILCYFYVDNLASIHKYYR
jgi:exopolysaccharide production protein ExoQ